MEKIWQPKSFEAEHIYVCSLGVLRLWLKRDQQDCCLAYLLPADQSSPTHWHVASDQDMPTAGSWRCWAVASESVQLLPAMPDRPLVVKLYPDFVIPAGGQAQFYVDIPTWVRVVAGTSNPITLDALPSRLLSNTWFGDSTAGTLCYSWTAKLSRSYQASDGINGMAVCPIFIRNESPTELDFRQLFVPVGSLGLYAGRSRFWTNALQLQFRGAAEKNELEVAAEAPGYEEIERQVCKPRETSERNIFAKGIDALKMLRGID